jgi:hypothetical protein
MAWIIACKFGESNEGTQMCKPMGARPKPKADYKIAFHVWTSVIMAASSSSNVAK